MRVRLLTLLLLWAGLSAASAAPISLTLGPPAGAPAGVARPSGFNYGLAMQVALYAAEWEALGVRALRFPPGNDADNAPLTPDMMDAFKVQWALLGEPEVWVVANFFEGPEHAAEAARYFDRIGVPVRHWAVGNEPDLYPQNRMDATWTPAVYCERLRGFSAALKAVNPENRITGPAVSGSRPLGEDYLRAVLHGCGNLLDVLTWHVYPTDGTWEDAAALETSRQVGEEIRRYRAWLEDPARNPRGHTQDTALAVTEFGLSWRTASYRHLEDLTAALWLADVLGQLTAEGVAGFYFALQGFGGHGLIDGGGWVRPTYHVYEMLSDFEGQVLTPTLEPAPSDVTAYAVCRKGRAQVLLVNRGETDANVRLEPAPAAPVTYTLLSDASLEATGGTQTGTAEAGTPLPLPGRSAIVATLEEDAICP